MKIFHIQGIATLLSLLALSCGKLEEKDQSVPRAPIADVSGTGIEAIWTYWTDSNASATFPTPIQVTNARVTFVGTREFFVQESASGQGVHVYSTLGNNTAPTGVDRLPEVGDVVSFGAVKWTSFRGEREVTEVTGWTKGEKRSIDDLISEGDSIDWDTASAPNLNKIFRITAKIMDSPCKAAGSSLVNWTLKTAGYSGSALILRTTCNTAALAWVAGVCVKVVGPISVFTNNGVTSYQLQHILADEPVTTIACPTEIQ
ncbi:MAG TPA: hypothetical protein VFO10_12625 [Oligoflexus sp.]|uniref:hypothetical protein n=1 Tax=Oligoflexus sp. TaxID=1971216 RepID=UPI002D7FF158|nr:hypothetical protein [Oligoflexus sp.]HET9238095.1 hypothetical protein [Oligoflexus sp.]